MPPRKVSSNSKSRKAPRQPSKIVPTKSLEFQAVTPPQPKRSLEAVMNIYWRALQEDRSSTVEDIVSMVLPFGLGTRSPSDDAFGHTEGLTPFLMAVKACRADVVNYLLTNFTDDFSSVKDERGCCASFYALFNKDLTMVKLLIANNIFDSRESLNVACQYTSLSMVTFLIEQGVSPTDVDGRFGNTPLHSLLSQQIPIGTNIKLVSLLISCGTPVNATNKLGDTALHLAIRSKRLEEALLLLQHGADPSIANYVHWVALHELCQKDLRRHGMSSGLILTVASSLLNCGSPSDLNRLDRYSVTPLCLCLMTRNNFLMQFLLCHGADTALSRCDAERHLFHNFVEMGNAIPNLTLLTNNGAEINYLNEDNQTPYQLALSLHRPSEARFLLGEGAHFTTL